MAFSRAMLRNSSASASGMNRFSASTLRQIPPMMMNGTFMLRRSMMMTTNATSPLYTTASLLSRQSLTSLTNSKCLRSKNCACTMCSRPMFKRSISNANNAKPVDEAEVHRVLNAYVKNKFAASPLGSYVSPAHIDMLSDSTRLQHFVSTFLLVSTPIALYLSPGFITSILDLAFSVAVPVHMWKMLKNVQEDYLFNNKVLFNAVYYTTLLLTVIAFFGILKINLGGPGLIATIKSLWVRPVDKN